MYLIIIMRIFILPLLYSKLMSISCNKKYIFSYHFNRKFLLDKRSKWRKKKTIHDILISCKKMT